MHGAGWRQAPRGLGPVLRADGPGDVTDAAACFRQETFGPLVAIYPVDSVDEAIKAANDTEYGLNASVFAGSSSEANAIADQLRAGTVNINESYAAAWGSTAAPMVAWAPRASVGATATKAC